MEESSNSNSNSGTLIHHLKALNRKNISLDYNFKIILWFRFWCSRRILFGWRSKKHQFAKNCRDWSSGSFWNHPRKSESVSKYLQTCSGILVRFVVSTLLFQLLFRFCPFLLIKNIRLNHFKLCQKTRTYLIIISSVLQ